MVADRTLHPTICFVTLGCAKNEADSEHMEKRVADAGFEIVDDIAIADAVIVNTCSFIQAAAEESLETIFDIADSEPMRTGAAKLIVSGCLPARYGSDLAHELTEANALVPCSEEDDIVDVLVRALGLVAPPAKPSHGATHGCRGGERFAGARRHPSAYLKISDGCDRFCSYCTIPFIRGRYRSYPLEQIMEEASSMIEEGVREIVLVAQDTGRWGEDFDEPSSLAALLSTLAVRFEDTWFRVMYLQPDGIEDSLLHVIAARKNVCSYLDIPIQHVNAAILKAMNRSGSSDELARLVAHIRSIVPGIALRTTVMAGFPGESGEAFEELCAFIEDGAFDYVGVFPYSREEGTKAASLSDQLDEETKIDRAQKLRDIADAVGYAKVSERIGTELDVLVLGHEEDGQLYGRAQCQAPEVDGVTYLTQGSIGDIITLTVHDTLLYEMEGA